jgi:undecaprenyl-diphosphatase
MILPFYFDVSGEAEILPGRRERRFSVDVIETLDQGTRDWVLTNQSQGVQTVLESVTRLGDRVFLGVLVAALLLGVLLAWLVWRRRYPRPVWRDLFRCAVLLVAAALASFALVEGTKRLVARPRPPSAKPSDSAHPSTFSFPSGHAFSSAAVYGTLALLVGARLPRPWQRRILAYGTLILVFLIGASRVYLNAHYLTDVLGGWAGGLGCALVCSWLDQRWSAATTKQATPAVAGDPPGSPG